MKGADVMHAELAALIDKATEQDLADGGRYFADSFDDLTRCRHEEIGEYQRPADGQLVQWLWNHRSAILALLATDRAAGVGEQWLSIETAPRDGTWFIADGGGLDRPTPMKWCERTGAWESDEVMLEDWDNQSEGYSRPLFWWPIPSRDTAPPAPADASGDEGFPTRKHEAERVEELREALIHADLKIRSFPGADQSDVDFIRTVLNEMPCASDEERIDPRTGRPLGDHGTASQAIEFLLYHRQAPGEETEFLKAWQEGDLADWPEFYEWLARLEAGSSAAPQVGYGAGG